jgi:hypothetical protein
MLRYKVQQPEGLLVNYMHLVKLTNKIIFKNVGTLKLTHPHTQWVALKLPHAANHPRR